ncbi:MAG TPA: hypothetical protein VFE18_18260 [Phenylobacterium sp.]|jgi:hypothetical protein|uniref:hypothetical protein n=1 Tax=Phenylobacterium sp. TaxID=1871053 RepID=UPI002D2B9EC9|nr:hypothetical protein [Phenylobacterium sp.]HZZ70121.1 hypothetical protein [Phenylobacterium sp.]
MRRRDLIACLAVAGTAVLAAPALAADEKKKKSGGEDYLPIDPITGTTNKAGGRRGVLSVDCGLQIEDAKLREYADQSMPRLRAAYVQVIQVYAAGLPSGSEPNVDFIVQALQRQTDLILKRPGAKLLVGAVVAN